MPYQVKGWDEFQHYKKRRPPWIKLHRSLLDDYTFSRLPDASRALAPCIWLLASESDDGSIPDDPNELGFRLRQSGQWIEKAVKPLVDNGFLICLQDASNMLATRKQDALSETEERQRREESTEKRGASLSAFTKPTPQEVDAYIKKMGYRGFTGQQFIDHYTANGWRVGRNPMKDWMAAVRTWSSRNKVVPKHDNLTGSSSNPDRPCQYCGKPYPCKCYEGE